MARPRITEPEKRKERLNPRLTTSERAAIEYNAAAFGLSPSEFMRRRSLDYHLPPTAIEARAQAILGTALMRLGINLNQIARHMNAGRPAPGDSISDLIARINAAMDGIYGPGADGWRP